MTRIFTSVLAIFISFSLPAQWAYVGSIGFTNPSVGHLSMTLSNNGQPTVVYRDAYQVSTARVMQFDGTNWGDLGTPNFSSPGYVYTPSIVYDTSGTCYVAYCDWHHNKKATVMKYDGISWSSVGPEGFTAAFASHTSIALDNNGTPYVAFRDGSYNYRASVMKFDGTSWVYVGTPGFSSLGNGFEGAFGNVLKIDQWDNLFIAFTDYSNGFKATVMKYDGSTWSNVGSGAISSGEISEPALVLDSQGFPIVAFDDQLKGNKATVMKFNGSSWDTIGIPGFTPGSVEHVSLAISRTDQLYIAFPDGANSMKASVMAWDGNIWANVGQFGFSTSASEDISISVDDLNSTLYVAYKDASANYKATVMKYVMPLRNNKHEEGNPFGIYPNPATNTVYLVPQSNVISDPVLLNLYNPLGQIAYTSRISFLNNAPIEVDLHDLPAGIYHAQIKILSSTSKSFTTKLILLD